LGARFLHVGLGALYAWVAAEGKINRLGQRDLRLSRDECSAQQQQQQCEALRSRASGGQVSGDRANFDRGIHA